MKSNIPNEQASRLLQIVLIGLLLFKATSQPVQADDTNEAVLRLTVELRDGSRVVGESLDQKFPFHSVLLGDLNLAVKDIRTVDCVKTNSVKLTMAGGDEMAVQFVRSELRLKTGFGKVELPVDSIRRIGVSVTHPLAKLPDGLVALWSAEGNADDSVGGNNGNSPFGVEYVAGKAGKAFKFNGVNQYISIPDAPSVRPTSLTVVAWINFMSTITPHIVAAKPYGLGTSDSYAVWYDGAAIHGYITTASGEGPYLNYAWRPDPGTWHHVAYEIDSLANTQALFVDGVSVASGTVSGSIAYDAHPLLIGADSDNGNLWGWFDGLIDEICIYNQALSADEIKAIYENAKPDSSAPTR